jgi:hypothetical protein
MKPISPYLDAIEILRRIRRDDGAVDLKFVDPETDEHFHTTVALGSLEQLNATFKDHEGCEAYVYPELPDGQGVAFLAACLSEAKALDWTGWRAPIVIGKDDSVYAVWPFDEPATRDEALEALFARNAASIDDPVPLPLGSDGVRLSELNDGPVTRALLDGYVLSAGKAGPVARRLVRPDGASARLCGQGFEILDALDPQTANQKIALSCTTGRTNARASKASWSLKEVLNSFMTFEERETKDGVAVVLGHFSKQRRQNDKVIKIGALGFDFDGAIELETFDADFSEMSLLGVRYTTFTHGSDRTRLPVKSLERFCGGEEIGDEEVRAYLHEKKRWAELYVQSARIVDREDEDLIIAHAPVAKFRLIIPLAEPITPGALGVEPGRAFAESFKDFMAAAIDALGLEGADEACTNIARLFYVPSVHPDSEASSRLFAGDLFNWRALKLDAACPVREAPSGKRERKSLSAGKRKSARRSATTDMGRRLGAWSAAASEGFQVRDFLADIASEDVRETKSDKSVIACPFEDQHTQIDPDDTACMAADPGWKGAPIFQINCLHEGCRDYNQLDMLGALIESGKAPVSWLMDDRYYAKTVDMCRVRTALIKALDDEEERKQAISDFIAEHDEKAGEALVHQIYDLIEASGVNNKARRMLLDKLTHHTGADLDEMMTRGVSLTLPDGSAYVFDEPGYELDRHDDGVAWIYASGNENRKVSPKPVCAALAVRHDIVLLDEDRDVRIEVLFHAGAEGWKGVEFGRASLARPVEVLDNLAGKGMRFSKLGRTFAPDFIASKTVDIVYHYSRAGWRALPEDIAGSEERVFITPCGEVIPHHPKLGLRAAVRMSGELTQAGSFEQWQSLIRQVMKLDGVDHIRAGVVFGLCGPILDLLGEKSFSVLIEGESRFGKSEGVRLAAGHWGYPDYGKDTGLLNRASATKNALIRSLVAGSGAMVGIDEIGRREAKDQVDLIFDIEGGQDRARLKKDMELAPTRNWGGMVAMMTSEASFSERLRAEKVKAESGAAARFLPINAQNGRILSRDELAIIKQVQRHYGHSGPAFVRAMVENGVHHQCEELTQRIEEYVIVLAGEDAAPIKKSATRMLAIMWVVAELIRDLGLIEDVYDIEALVRSIYEEAQEYDFKAERPVERAIRELLDTIVREKGNRIVADYEDRAKDRFGFYGKHAEAVGRDGEVRDHEVYVLHTSAIDEVTGHLVSKNALLKALHERGILLTQPRRKQKLNVWRGFPGIAGDNASFVVLSAEQIDGAACDKDEAYAPHGEVVDMAQERNARF